MNKEDSLHLREIVNKAIEDHIITRSEYDMIVGMAISDGEFDPEEQALLSDLQEMLHDGLIKFR